MTSLSFELNDERDCWQRYIKTLLLSARDVRPVLYDLTLTFCDDETLLSIAQASYRLAKLKLVDCTKISNQGLMCAVSAVSESLETLYLLRMDNMLESVVKYTFSGACKKLQRVDVVCCRRCCLTTATMALIRESSIQFSHQLDGSLFSKKKSDACDNV